MAKRDAALPPTARAGAGAVAAAARELRPAEIVGVYEAQREATEAELAVLKQEVGGAFEGAGDCSFQNRVRAFTNG